MSKSPLDTNPLQAQSDDTLEHPITAQRITHFTTRMKLPDSPRRKSKRKSAAEELPPRPKSEQELREEAAWKQVEETGKPVVLDGNLLLPDGMKLKEAFQFLPEPLREETADAWDRKLSEVWEYISRSTEEQIRQKAQEEGKLEYYNSLPVYARTALLESVIRQQWGYPEVPFEQLLEKWKNSSNEVEDTSSQTKKKKTPKQKRQVPPVPVKERAEDKREIAPQVYQDQERSQMTSQSPSLSPTTPTIDSESALNWNREHHRFLLRRLDQIWSYFDAEEQKAVMELLKIRLGKEEIDQIDEIVKGVVWVRGIQK